MTFINKQRQQEYRFERTHHRVFVRIDGNHRETNWNIRITVAIIAYFE